MSFETLADVNISVSAPTVAWYAAIIGTFGGIKAVVDLWNDRGRILIQYKSGMSVRNTRGMYDETKLYFQTVVINKGRRPILVTHVGAKFFGQQETSLFADSFLQGVDRTLTESKPATTYVTDQSGMKVKNLWYVYAIDARGKEFRKYSDDLAWFLKLYYKIRKHKNDIKLKKPKFGVGK